MNLKTFRAYRCEGCLRHPVLCPYKYCNHEGVDFEEHPVIKESGPAEPDSALLRPSLHVSFALVFCGLLLTLGCFVAFALLR